MLMKLWQKLQNEGYRAYRKSPKGTFSVKSCKTANIFGEFIRNNLYGICIDIGCGLLPTPQYMKGQDNIRFFGVDPYQDKIDRSFEFAVAIGEELPFRSETFDGAMFASSIDHAINPKNALIEARRVLKNNGKLFVWYKRVKTAHYDGTRYDKFHQ